MTQEKLTSTSLAMFNFLTVAGTPLDPAFERSVD